MTVNIDFKKALNNLTCPICYQLFGKPKFLPCHHSYCEECLEKMQVQSKIVCPECRAVATVPVEGVKKLPTNFLITRLVDELILKRKVVGEDKAKCDDCSEDDPVVSYCPDCDSFRCHICSEAHKRNKRYLNHNLLPLNELQSLNDMQQIKPKSKVLLCEDHENELNYYCDTCKKLVCTYCTIKDHSGHNHDTVKKMAAKQRINLEEIACQVEEILRSLCITHDQIEMAKKKILKQGDNVNMKIDQLYDVLISELNQQRDQVKQQLRDAVTLKEKMATTQLEDVECVQAEVMSMKELNSTLGKCSDQETLSAKEQVFGRMKRLTEMYNMLNTEPAHADMIELVVNDVSLPQFCQLFLNIDPVNTAIERLPRKTYKGNKVEFQIFTRYDNNLPCQKGGSRVSVQLESSSGEVTAAQIQDNNDGSYTASFEAQEVGKARVLACINGQHIDPYIVTVNANYTNISKPAKIINNDGKMGCPWGIAFSTNGVWAVADHSQHCVYIFDQQNQLIWKFGSKGNKTGQFDTLYGITFDDDNNLYIAEYSKDRVQKFDVGGQFLMTFGGKGCGNGQLSSPVGITSHRNEIYVAEANNNRVSVFTQDGNFCRHIGSGVLNTPYDLAINVNNQLLVVDYAHNCVYIFTLYGDSIGKFEAKENGKSQLNHPCSIATDSSGCVLVVDTGNYRVVIFDADGNVLHSFGSKGCGNGQFYDPHGIALSPNGTIYVSDNRNRRIQVFTNC